MNTIKAFEYDIVKSHQGKGARELPSNSVLFEVKREDGALMSRIIISVKEDKIHVYKSGFYYEISIHPKGINQINIS